MSQVVITRAQVLHVARLARLQLDETQLARMTEQLGSILDYMQRLNELDTSTVEPTCQLGAESLPVRADDPQQGLTREVALAGCARSAHQGFAVPAFIDE